MGRAGLPYGDWSDGFGGRLVGRMNETWRLIRWVRRKMSSGKVGTDAKEL